MKLLSTILLFSFFTLFTGCDSSLEKDLEGKWEMNDPTTTGLKSLEINFKGGGEYELSYTLSNNAGYGSGNGEWEVDDEKLILDMAAGEQKYSFDVSESELTIFDFTMYKTNIIDNEAVHTVIEYGDVVLKKI